MDRLEDVKPVGSAPADADHVKTVRGNTLDEILAWVESWNTPDELPEPVSREFRQRQSNLRGRGSGNDLPLVLVRPAALCRHPATIVASP